MSRERDEYRRQIKDREQWAATMLKNKDALHRIEMERITAELGRVIAVRTEVAERALTILERTAEARTEYDAAIDALRTRWKATLADLLNSTTLLAMMLSFETPERRQRALALLTPAMVTITDAMIARAIEPAPPTSRRRPRRWFWRRARRSGCSRCDLRTRRMG